MSKKYEPLRQYLQASGQRILVMTFAEIASLVDGLPPSAYNHRVWWSNNELNCVQIRSWLDAKYRTANVDLSHRFLWFMAESHTWQLIVITNKGEQFVTVHALDLDHAYAEAKSVVIREGNVPLSIECARLLPDDKRSEE